MRFTEILEIIGDETTQFWDWIESIRYNEASDIYMVEFTASEDLICFNFNVVLFDGGDIVFGFDGENITYIPIDVAKLISNIAHRWELYWDTKNDDD